MLTRSIIAFSLGAALVPLAMLTGSVSVAHAQEGSAPGHRVQSDNAQDYLGTFGQQQPDSRVASKSSKRTQLIPAVQPFTAFEKRWFDYQDQD